MFVCDSGGERARAPHLRPVLGSLINLEGCNCFELYLMVCAAGLPGSGEKQQSHESYCWGQSPALGKRERVLVCKKVPGTSHRLLPSICNYQALSYTIFGHPPSAFVSPLPSTQCFLAMFTLHFDFSVVRIRYFLVDSNVQAIFFFLTVIFSSTF